MEGHAVRVLGESVPEAVVLSDVLELAGDGRFRLIGRGADMINIAGKRASLADLNLKLCSIEGVRDGAFLVPDRDGDDVRLLAVVVAPGLSKGDIARELRALIDPVFVPRRVYFVAELPRSETGKLPRDALLNLIARAEYRA
jgi:acyl-coenzyme A synthetase/AMP-(fatty) acid ligase